MTIKRLLHKKERGMLVEGIISRIGSGGRGLVQRARPRSSNEHRRSQPSVRAPIRIDDTEGIALHHRLHKKSIRTDSCIIWASISVSGPIGATSRSIFTTKRGKPAWILQAMDGFIDQSQHWSMHDEMPSDWRLTSFQWLYPCGVLHCGGRLLPNFACTPDSYMH